MNEQEEVLISAACANKPYLDFSFVFYLRHVSKRHHIVSKSTLNQRFSNSRIDGQLPFTKVDWVHKMLLLGHHHSLLEGLGIVFHE